MKRDFHLYPGRWLAAGRTLPWFLGIFLSGALLDQTHAQAAQSNSNVVLDRVVAVVNNQAILASDLGEEVSLAILDPNQDGQALPTPRQTLEQLIARTLIEQQIRQDDAQNIDPQPEEVKSRMAEIRKDLPACMHQNCVSDEGWKAFLAAHDLTPERVESYLRYRLRILRFIELRFRQGISISDDEVETYYRNTLLPQYRAGETVPQLDQVSSRIQEILLQQQVNHLFDDWLLKLRNQGEVQVLDPTLEKAQESAKTPAAKEAGKEQDK
jgi:hypothetical protein